MNKIKVSILGGSGYAGGEILRILLDHPGVEIAQVSSRKLAGEPVTLAHPNLRKKTGLVFTHPDELAPCDLIFAALPNTKSMARIAELKKLAPRIIDLGADFRLRDAKTFESWYKMPHAAPELLPEFVYAMPELYREELKKANFAAGAGCEATVSILSLYPLVRRNLIEENVIIDAKMSSSQAGAEATASSHHPERAGVVRSYLPTGHRHTAEIEQELKGLRVQISATAIDMVRGLLVTIHAVPRAGVTEKDVWKAYREAYKDEPFMRIVKEKQGLYRYPEPKILQGTNYCDVGFEMDPRGDRLVVIGAIDNLVKGTAGHVVQAMNLMCGFPETTALEFPGLHPI